MFEFKPRLIDQRAGSKRPADLPPRWYRPCLGAVVERNGAAWFLPSTAHPALKVCEPRLLGAADNDDDAMMAQAQKAYREAQQAKKAFRALRLARVAKRAEGGMK